MVNNLKNLLTGWKKSDYISVPTYRKIYCSDGMLPRAYGLPKIHKPNCPFRVIISSIDSPLYSLATFLDEIINSSIPKACGYIGNSYELFNSLNDRVLSSEFCLISLDVISLFTNIPIDLAMEIDFRLHIFYFWQSDLQTKLWDTDGLSAFPRHSGYCYAKPWEIGAENDFHIPIYYRYVDDILMTVPKNKINWVLDAFNSFNSRLQFTLEVGDDHINFLVTTIILHNNKIKLD